eukprot:gnl/MRDRNA2_/MRDRNA2_60351_c0_seq1.p1 gnl/MRDRNA2_/MRDRNA2_60351_c0~~gnl/MRDRNA2_/MRDRNA2_60351_c0_seq1.p1  ORF type:complete len:523 (-),score=74.30 gnl/MRDRNA2_/MRDRNA2_60351_c0_seq1:43-1392(-)
MPFVPLVDTGVESDQQVISPPSMLTEGAICPSLPSDLILVNATFNRKPTVFLPGESDSRELPRSGLTPCTKPDPFYTKYLLARSRGSRIADGIPVLGSKFAPDAALIKAAETIAEMLRQMDKKIPGIRRAMVQHGQRFAVWADSERRTDTCEYCQNLDPTFDCKDHIDSRAGRDTSYHPEVPQCQEGGGASLLSPTTYCEEYGIPYLEASGSIRKTYCGTNIVAHEFFHSVHDVAIKTIARPLYFRIEQAAAKAVHEGIYTHHPGAKDDGCNDDFATCVAFEFIVKAQMVWNGFPSKRAEFRYQSRAEIKARAPWLAELLFEMFEDGSWNPAMGVKITEPRDQTFGLTCATAPGSALCGEKLGKNYIGPPMDEVLEKCGSDCFKAAVTSPVRNVHPIKHSEPQQALSTNKSHCHIALFVGVILGFALTLRWGETTMKVLSNTGPGHRSS